MARDKESKEMIKKASTVKCRARTHSSHRCCWVWCCGEPAVTRFEVHFKERRQRPSVPPRPTEPWPRPTERAPARPSADEVRAAARASHRAVTYITLF